MKETTKGRPDLQHSNSIRRLTPSSKTIVPFNRGRLPMEGGSRHQMARREVHPIIHEAILMLSTRDLQMSMQGRLLLVDLVNSENLRLHGMRS